MNINNLTWRILDTGFNNSYLNMAIDEAILQSMTPESRPVLRFYDWERSAISIGYSQKVREVLDVEKCEQDDVPVVRRPTGGGVVFHGVDITYSVIFPGALSGSIHDVYQKIHGYVVAGLEKGDSALFYSKKRPTSSTQGYCFVSTNIGDIMIGSRKLAGLAARRIKHRVLCQGYIYYENAEKLADYVKGNRIRESLKEKAVYLRELTDKDSAGVKKAIIAKWPGNQEKSSLTAKEQQLASNLCEVKYSQREWNYRR